MVIIIQGGGIDHLVDEVNISLLSIKNGVILDSRDGEFSVMLHDHGIYNQSNRICGPPHGESPLRYLSQRRIKLPGIGSVS